MTKLPPMKTHAHISNTKRCFIRISWSWNMSASRPLSHLSVHSAPYCSVRATPRWSDHLYSQSFSSTDTARTKQRCTWRSKHIFNSSHFSKKSSRFSNSLDRKTPLKNMLKYRFLDSHASHHLDLPRQGVSTPFLPQVQKFGKTLLSTTSAILESRKKKSGQGTWALWFWRIFGS